MFQAQSQYEEAQRAAVQAAIAYPEAPPAYGAVATPSSSLYPSLDDWMGLNFTPDFIKENMPVVAANSVRYLVELHLNSWICFIFETTNLIDYAIICCTTTVH